MEFKVTKSKVYIQINHQGHIIQCEGGYTINNIKNIDDWILVDEGTGDKYNLCQSHYFDGGLYTMDGIPRYRWDGSETILRSDAELEADRAARPAPPPSTEEVLLELAADHEARLCEIELGV